MQEVNFFVRPRRNQNLTFFYFSCNAGFYSNGGAICTLVPAGSFSGPGASQPTPCPRNTYQNFAGATRCLGCSLTDLSIMYAPVGSTSCGNSYPVELTIHHLGKFDLILTSNFVFLFDFPYIFLTHTLSSLY